MNIIPMCQRDLRWGNKLLGFNTDKRFTISSYGCLITCVSCVCNYYGETTDPNKMNEDLKQISGFANGGYYVWGSVTRLYPEIKESVVYTPTLLTNDQMLRIKNSIKNDHPVMLEIDFAPQTSVADMHFVLATDWDDSDEDNITIMDPWTGTIQSLKTYLKDTKPTARRTINQFIIYEKEVSQVDEIISLRQEIVKLENNYKELSDKYVKEVKDATEHIKNLQSTVAEQNTQVVAMNETIRTLTLEKNRVLEDSVTLRQELVDMTASKNDCLAQIGKLEKKIENSHFVLLCTVLSRIWAGKESMTGFPVPDPETARYLTRFKLKGIGTDAISFESARMSSVSTRPSYSSTERTTAAGRPERVIVIPSPSRSTSASSLARWVFACESGTVVIVALRP